MAHLQTSAPIHPPEDITGILAWLAAPIPDDPVLDLAPFQRRLAALERTRLEPARYHRILDLFHDRAHRLSLELKPRLTQASPPLEHGPRAAAAALVEIHGQIAAGYERVLEDAGDRLRHNKRRNPAIIAARALRSLNEQLETACMAAAQAPTQMWRRAHALARIGREYFEPEATVIPGIDLDAESIYKGMLALAAAQPEGLAAEQVALAGDYLGRFSAAVELTTAAPPPEGSEGWYWVDTARDMAPVPPNRRIPPHHGELLFCSFQRLARLLAEQTSSLATGAPPGNLRLPDAAAGHAGRAALRHLQAHWTDPPHRKFTRRHNASRAQICIGLTELWQMLEDGEGTGGMQTGTARTTEWMILNESPTGFAVMHVAGELGGLVPGSAIALRAAADRPWSICIVRWMKSDNPAHVELGLELISPAARKVHILFRNGNAAQRPTQGLLLPALPAVREHPALLAPCGSYSARRFFIVSGGEKTHVMQGRLLSLDMQTGSVELFQFEPDPYPI